MANVNRRLASPRLTVTVLLLVLTSTVYDAAAAQLCGDPDRSDTVTATDGVQCLRAAAGLSTTCSVGICDLNVDGQITVTDGILILRVAGELATASCPDAQAAGVITRTRGILEVGIGAPETHGAATHASAATTNACADGGSTIDNGNGFTDVDCRRGDLVSNGTVTITTHPGTQDFDIVFEAFSVTRLSTGETLVTSGSVSFTRDTSGLRFNGTVSRSSTSLGTFSDTYGDGRAVTTDASAALTSGQVTTTVTQGSGAFKHVRTIETTIGGPQLAVAVVTFDDGSPRSFVFADDIGLCDACTTNVQCNTQLACTPCVQDCTGTTSRCSVPFGDVGARCVDGLF